MKNLILSLVAAALVACGGQSETNQNVDAISDKPIEKPAAQGGLALTIDDGVSLPFLIDNLDIFDRYDAKATFYVSHYTDKKAEDLLYLQSKGFEIGHHSQWHRDAPKEAERIGLSNWLINEVLNPLAAMSEKGIEIQTFAYPFGHYTVETNEALKPYFSHVRGFGGTRKGDYSEGFYSDGYFYFGVSVDSPWLDRMALMQAMDRASETGETLVIGMHVISHDWENDYKITPADLEFIIKYASEIGLEFKLMREL